LTRACAVAEPATTMRSAATILFINKRLFLTAKLLRIYPGTSDASSRLQRGSRLADPPSDAGQTNREMWIKCGEIMHFDIYCRMP
jgi:hypothetical protein